MSRRDPLIRLRDMRDAAREAVAFVGQKQYQEFARDTVLFRAVVKTIEMIGEAASRVVEETKKRVVGVPWVGVVGMRNRLVHGYFEIDPEQVWRVVADDLPGLIGPLDYFLGEETPGEE